MKTLPGKNNWPKLLRLTESIMAIASAGITKDCVYFENDPKNKPKTIAVRRIKLRLMINRLKYVFIFISVAKIKVFRLRPKNGAQFFGNMRKGLEEIPDSQEAPVDARVPVQLMLHKSVFQKRKLHNSFVAYKTHSF